MQSPGSPTTAKRVGTTALVLVGLASCFRALPEPDPNVACETNDECPAGYYCKSAVRTCCLSGDLACGTNPGDSTRDGSATETGQSIDLGSRDDGPSVRETAGAGGAVGSGGVAGLDAPMQGGGGGAISATGGTGGGQPGAGGAIATGGMNGHSGGVTGSGVSSTGGAGGTLGCGGTMKPCNGACITAAECCGGCGGNTPVCNNGICVKRNTGQACGGDAECGSDYCSDGYCCDTACDGQCESCKVAGNLGTCLPVTAPRIACAGTGTCAGRCDGTAQNRKACVFPGNTTTCGSAASCTNGTLTSAAACNGAGSCTSGSVVACTFGCRTDGVPACATTCPNNQGLCGGSCVDVESSPSHCGISCQLCQGATPKCSSGACVQCAVAGDCSGQGMTCTAQNTCRCSAGYHACGATTSPCYSDTDVSHCGNGCTDCRQANANAACGQGDLCANTCKDSAYALSCPAVAGKPNCSHWDFESGDATREGWQLAPLPSASSASAGALTLSTGQHATGAASLAIRYDNSGDTAKYVEVRTQLCAGGNVLNLSGKRIHWSFRMDPPATAISGYNYLTVYETANFGGGGGLFDFNADSDGVWREFDNQLQSTVFDQVAGIGFHLQATEDWSGTIYLDDIRIY